MNFWEARQAAKAGKKVKIVGQEVGKDGGLNWEMWQFVNGWSEHELDAQWEIVEEPKQAVHYYPVYSRGCDAWLGTRHKNEDDAISSDPDYIGRIEIITDEDGSLFSARNI
jgi:hypothetical protein